MEDFHWKTPKEGTLKDIYNLRNGPLLSRALARIQLFSELKYKGISICLPLSCSFIPTKQKLEILLHRTYALNGLLATNPG